MTTEDIAYLTALVEKSPSTYRRRKELVEELQYIFKRATTSQYKSWRTPIMTTLDVFDVY